MGSPVIALSQRVKVWGVYNPPHTFHTFRGVKDVINHMFFTRFTGLSKVQGAGQ